MIFVRKPEGRRPFGRPGYTRDNNFDNFEAGLQNSVLMLGTACVQLRALVNTAMKFCVLIKLGNLLSDLLHDEDLLSVLNGIL
jgi:hypothetical protein